MQPASLYIRFRENIGTELIWGLLLWGLLTTAYLLYAPALDAPWHFDDAPNLQGLSKVHDRDSAMAFIASGVSSSLGRPVALATFLPNAPAWPSEPSVFRHVNVLIHLLNGVLITWIALRVARLHLTTDNQATWPALTLAALWLLHPFLASTSLLVVQRMTSIAATITLVGILAFIHGRSLLANQPRAAYAWMSLALILGSGLGTLAKENAALLPFFAAALSLTVLNHLAAGNQRLWRIWQFVFFAGPAVMLLIYISVNWPSILQGYATRPFSLEERMLTQPVVLWGYLQQILVPNVSQMGPFHDDAVIQTRLSLSSLSAILGLIALLSSAMALRKRFPWFTFAVLWFLAGHLLESTIFNLELYFEHRNYLPSLGPLAALVALAWTSRKAWPRFAVSASVFIIALLLWQVTTLWGTPLMAAERWSSNHPTSSRATQFLSQRYVLQGDPEKALDVIRHGSLANPAVSDLAVQTIQLSCGLVDEDRIRDLVDTLIERAHTLQASLATAKATNSIRLQIEDGNCPGLDDKRFIRLIYALLENPAIHSYGLIRHHLHRQLAMIHTRNGNLDGTIKNLIVAFDVHPSAEVAQQIAVTFASAGLYREAIQSIDHAMTKAPSIDLKRRYWEDALNQLKKSLLIEAYSAKTEAPILE